MKCLCSKGKEKNKKTNYIFNDCHIMVAKPYINLNLLISIHNYTTK